MLKWLFISCKENGNWTDFYANLILFLPSLFSDLRFFGTWIDILVTDQFYVWFVMRLLFGYRICVCEFCIRVFCAIRWSNILRFLKNSCVHTHSQVQRASNRINLLFQVLISMLTNTIWIIIGGLCVACFQNEHYSMYVWFLFHVKYTFCVLW